MGSGGTGPPLVYHPFGPQQPHSHPTFPTVSSARPMIFVDPELFWAASEAPRLLLITVSVLLRPPEAPSLPYHWANLTSRLQGHLTSAQSLPSPSRGHRRAFCTVLACPPDLSPLLFSCSVVSDSLQPHELQHARLPYPPPSPGVCPNSCPLSQWCHPTISSSVVPFSSCLQSFPASGSFLMSQLFASGGQSIGASTSVLPMNIQDWFPLGLTGLISLQSKGL